jgi:predicted nuclease of predicted toxin-antitoxin system
MKFLLDENFPKSIIPILRENGHQALDFREVGVIGAPDEDVIMLAIEEEAVILTTDRDFFHTLSKSKPQHKGILVVALKQPNRQLIADRVKWFLDNVDEKDVAGRAFQLRDRTWLVFPSLY